MEAKQLTKIIWPASVDMIAQVVVAMTFFFLLMFVILAYFLKQIDLRQRVKVNEQTYQFLYEPFRRYIGKRDIKKLPPERKPNIDELLLQIRDYILSVPESRIQDIQSLIAKRNELVDELYNLGYTGYSATNPFSGDYTTMPIITTELLQSRGEWSVLVSNDNLLVRFEDNSLSPEANALARLRIEMSRYVRAQADKKFTINVYDSQLVQIDNLTQRLSLRRAVAIRNLIRSSDIPNDNIEIVHRGVSSRYLNGGIEISYE